MAETEAPSLTVDVKLAIKRYDIANLLVCAFEGGSNYWIGKTSYVEPRNPVPILDTEGPGGAALRQRPVEIFPHCDYPLVEGGAVLVTPDDEKKEYRLDLEAIKRGLSIMSEKEARHFADLISGNEDAVTGDVFLQCCLFGKAVYG